MFIVEKQNNKMRCLIEWEKLGSKVRKAKQLSTFAMYEIKWDHENLE